MALSRPVLWTAHSQSGGGSGPPEQRGGARLCVVDHMKMPSVFNGFIDVSSKLDTLALFFARLLSGSHERTQHVDLGQPTGDAPQGLALSFAHVTLDKQIPMGE